ncbi:hypothetical protein ACQGX2_000762 [Campylobacter jejuni]|uniref:hypothetical protein n=1 Tax=Campylobacter jejuni TaxID=197 RepID=UPI001CCEF565|nr:hypothetical protein [Campylobacter jejuni]
MGYYFASYFLAFFDENHTHFSQQARAYGVFEGGRGVVSTIHLAIATAIFGYFQTKALASRGIEMIIIFYSLAL